MFSTDSVLLFLTFTFNCLFGTAVTLTIGYGICWGVRRFKSNCGHCPVLGTPEPPKPQNPSPANHAYPINWAEVLIKCLPIISDQVLKLYGFPSCNPTTAPAQPVPKPDNESQPTCNYKPNYKPPAESCPQTKPATTDFKPVFDEDEIKPPTKRARTNSLRECDNTCPFTNEHKSGCPAECDPDCVTKGKAIIEPEICPFSEECESKCVDCPCSDKPLVTTCSDNSSNLSTTATSTTGTRPSWFRA